MLLNFLPPTVMASFIKSLQSGMSKEDIIGAQASIRTNFPFHLFKAKAICMRVRQVAIYKFFHTLTPPVVKRSDIKFRFFKRIPFSLTKDKWHVRNS